MHVCMYMDALIDTYMRTFANFYFVKHQLPESAFSSHTCVKVLI